MIFLNTQTDLFILKTDVEKFTSPYKKTLHLIFKISWREMWQETQEQIEDKAARFYGTVYTCWYWQQLLDCHNREWFDIFNNPTKSWQWVPSADIAKPRHQTFICDGVKCMYDTLDTTPITQSIQIKQRLHRGLFYVTARQAGTMFLVFTVIETINGFMDWNLITKQHNNQRDSREYCKISHILQHTYISRASIFLRFE